MQIHADLDPQHCLFDSQHLLDPAGHGVAQLQAVVLGDGVDDDPIYGRLVPPDSSGDDA